MLSNIFAVIRAAWIICWLPIMWLLVGLTYVVILITFGKEDADTYMGNIEE